ncbi:MAG: alpha-amylase family glycosyl hydrolase, partial [Saprospiraceae bacterium]
MKRTLLFLFLLTFLLSCKKDPQPVVVNPPDDSGEFAAPFTGVPDLKDMVFYEVNLRAYSQAGDLKGVQARLEEIKALGINVIWLMPINPVGQIKSAGGLGSPYSVKNYTEVNVEFGTLADLQNLVKAAHDKQMAVVIDWVANHTAWDNPWVTQHPGWYTQDASGNIQIPAGTNWQDVADLNYDSLAMRQAMIKSMKYWILRANIDGFRCDAADFVPSDFWKQAIDSLRNINANRKIIMLAEGSRFDQLTAGFQLNYAWDFYTTTKNVFQVGQSANKFAATQAAEYNGLPANTGKLRYITNHDESAWEGSPLAQLGGKKGAFTAFVITATMGGVPLIYGGQEVGRSDMTPFFTKSPIDWSANPEYLDQYKQLLTF